jgi:hypothetical protein
MEIKRTKSASPKDKPAIEDAFGLRPDEKTLHDKDGPPRDPNAPSGSLSSDDDEVTPVDFSIGT